MRCAAQVLWKSDVAKIGSWSDSLGVMPTMTSISSLESLTDRVIGGERITPEEALELYHLPLEELGALANHRRMLARDRCL
jgi:hypothetical protein